MRYFSPAGWRSWGAAGAVFARRKQEIAEKVRIRQFLEPVSCSRDPGPTPTVWSPPAPQAWSPWIEFGVFCVDFGVVSARAARLSMGSLRRRESKAALAEGGGDLSRSGRRAPPSAL